MPDPVVAELHSACAGLRADQQWTDSGCSHQKQQLPTPAQHEAAAGTTALCVCLACWILAEQISMQQYAHVHVICAAYPQVTAKGST